MGLGVLVAAPLAAAALARPARAAEGAPGTTPPLRFAAGARGGTYHAATAALARALGAANGVGSALVEGRGSVDHVGRLASGEVQAALVQSDVLIDAYEGNGAFAHPETALRAIGAVFGEAVHVVAREGLGAATVADLAKRRVAVGITGSGTSQSARAVLLLHGLGAGDLDLRPLGPAEASAALERGEIDAFFSTALAPDPLVAGLLASGTAALVPLGEAAAERLAVRDGAPGMRVMAVGADAYPGLAAPVRVAAVDAILCVRDDLPAVLASALAERMCAEDGRAALRAAHPGAGAHGPREAVEGLPVPLHKGALAFYEAAEVFERPVRVFVGVHMLAITDLDLKSGTFAADFYIWFRWRGRIGEADEGFAFELANGVIEGREAVTHERVGGWSYICYRVQARLRGRFLLHDYPFDDQRLELQVEATENNTREVLFVADDRDMQGRLLDLRAAAISPALTISDWRVTGASQRAVEHRYTTDFGSPEEGLHGQYAYPRFIFAIDIDRVLFPYLVKFCLPLVIIVLMAFATFFIKAREFEVQAGIVITALLSCVAFHVSQADSLPEVGYLVTADKFFMLSYVVIFLTLVEVVWENHVFHTRGEDNAERIDRWARRLFPVAFFGPVAYMIVSRL